MIRAMPRIVETCRCEGQQVAEGTLLFQLDDSELRARLTELELRYKLFGQDGAVRPLVWASRSSFLAAKIGTITESAIPASEQKPSQIAISEPPD